MQRHDSETHGGARTGRRSDQQRRVIENGAVAVRGERIVAVGETFTARSEFTLPTLC
jgi:hypothetical protein